jgi:hypothetical protein
MNKDLQNIIGNKNSFSVPDHYFEVLNNRLKSEVNLMDLTANKKDFDLPQNYFEKLKQEIESQVSLPQQQEHLFNTPNGYFENNKINILAKINPEKSNFKKVISLAFIRYAAAACILLTTSLGIYLNSLEIKTNANELSKIPTADLELYLQQNIESTDVQTIIENLPSEKVFSIKETEFEQQDISEYLNTTQ